jgi:serine protease Do
VLINRVFPGSPAASAGLRGGDIVIALGRSRVAGVKEFQKSVAGVSPGSLAVLEILRGGKRMTLSVTMAELERPSPRAVPRKPPMDPWGLSVKTLSKGVARALGIPGGVEVREVDPSGVAGAGGVREGDILLRINREQVTGRDSYRRMLGRLPRGQMVSLLVDRDGGPVYLAFRHR